MASERGECYSRQAPEVFVGQMGILATRGSNEEKAIKEATPDLYKQRMTHCSYRPYKSTKSEASKALNVAEGIFVDNVIWSHLPD